MPWRRPITGTALAYGGDELTERLESVVREVFEHPTARVFPVTSGTAANALVAERPVPAVGCRALPRHGARAQQRVRLDIAAGWRRRAARRAGRRLPRSLPTDCRRRSTACAGAIPTTRSRRCCRSHRRPTWERCTGSTRSRSSSGSPASTTCGSTSTGRASPTRWRRWGARQPISPGAPASTCSRSERRRTVPCRPRRSSPSTTAPPTSSSTAPSGPATSPRRCASSRRN